MVNEINTPELLDLTTKAIGGISSLVAIYMGIINRKIKRKNKIQAIELNSIMKLTGLRSFSLLVQAVNEIFHNTMATRFLVLIGLMVDGKLVKMGVVFEQHKETPKYPAIAVYKSLRPDRHYMSMIKDIMMHGTINVFTEKLPDSDLKGFYDTEGVKVSKVKYIGQKKVNKWFNIISYCSIASTEDRAWTNKERSVISSRFDSIIKPVIMESINNVDDSFESVLNDLTSNAL